MTTTPNSLLLLGLIQELQKKAADLGLTRTAAALEVTGHVATEELSDSMSRGGQMSPAPDEDEKAD